MKFLPSIAGILALGLVSGCSDSSPRYRGAPQGGAPAAAKRMQMGSGEGGETEMADALMNGLDGKGSQPPAPGEQPAKPMPPKIIRTGDINLIVDDFDPAFGKFKQLIDGIKGAYIAKAEISGSSGQPRTGVWKVRVPAVAFDSFLDRLTTLGMPERNVIDSRDVTEEFYDLEARLRNKKTEEARLIKHLETSTGKLDEILKVEHEISRVRGEVEQMEGRLRMIDNLATLTTVSVTIREIKNYRPPQAPTFATRIQQTFGDSTDALIGFGEIVTICAVGLAPWLPLLAIVAACIYAAVRYSKRRSVVPNVLSVQPEAGPPV